MRKITALSSAAIALILWCSGAAATPNTSADDAALSAAVCPIGYRVDQSPSWRGYRYLFYGNGFFINKEGYLITAAHMLSQLHGAQPYIVLRSAVAPPQLVPATVVAVDRDHDVAVLRATVNPFEGHYRVAFLPLTTDRPLRTQTVRAEALRPSHPRDAQTFDTFLEDRPSGEVFDYEFSQLEKGRSETEVFLFGHEVIPGESGAPVVLGKTNNVVGLIDGRWVRSSALPVVAAMKQPAAGVGAAVPIHYAIALLQQEGISWHRATGTPEPEEASRETGNESAVPTPLSLVGAPYPSQALLGGEVVLDALVDSTGRLADIRVVQGENPFLEKAVAAVRTWTFLTGRSNGHAVEGRVGIVFQFPQSFATLRAKPAHKYDEPLANAPTRGALPILTVEPEPASMTTAEGSVILYCGVDDRGEIKSVRVLRDLESLAPVALSAVRQWRFVPGRVGGANAESAAVVVVTFRRVARSTGTQPSEQSQ